MRLIHMRLRRWLALLVAGTLVPFLAFSAVAVYKYGREQRAASERVLQDAARALVVALDKHFEATITALLVLGTSDRLDDGDLRAFHQQCLRALAMRQEWRSISLFDVTGRRLSITSEPFGTVLPPPPEAMAGPFRRLVESRTPNVSDLFRSPVTQRAGVSVGVPIVRSGEVRWVISAGLSPDAIGRLLESQRVLPEWTGTILDRGYIIVADSRAPRLVGTAAPATLTGAAKTMLEGTVHDRTGEDVVALTAFSRSRAFGWTAAITVPVAGGVFGQPVRAILTAGLALLLIGVAVALWTGRRISRPIEALATAAQQIGRGETMASVVSGVTEVSALSAALAGAARDRARAEAELARYAERLRVLHDVDRALIAGETPLTIAEAVLPKLRDLLGVPRAIVNLFDLEAGEVEWLAAVGRHRFYDGPGVRYSLRLAGDLEALRRGEPQVMDVRSLPPSPEAEALLASDVRTYMVVPMIAGGELIGSVSFGGPTGEFPPEQVGIAQEVAAQLAIAITQARLHERVKRHAEELEQRVEERTAAANRANQAKSEFLSRMSHELRTPLNSVIGFGQLLEMGQLDDGQRESVERILVAGRHLLGLINEVLEISRIEAGVLRLSLEPVPVADTLRSAIDLVKPLAAQRRIELRGNLPDVSLHVMADHQRLQQVLLNLLSNAVKYNREGGLVTVTCAETAVERLQIHVTDTGRGIGADDIARLFTPFERFGAENSEVEGTGLGLTLSKRLLEAMGGTMQVESQVDVGSTFTLDLALAEAVDAIPMAVEPPSAVAPGSGGLVLYIEDNLSNFRLVERVLERRPRMRLLPAIQGRLGLDLAREHQPDLILLDLHLPDLPGEEVLRRLLAEPRTREIPVVVVSADATPGQIERLRAAGARDYLTKPLDVRQLLTVIDTHIAADR
ncbi:MAG TPA: ATP-binding protein [Methylomirabilota bacterium]|nr:ATP-binding protein [Methylomirabilota bacterium]